MIRRVDLMRFSQSHVSVGAAALLVLSLVVASIGAFSVVLAGAHGRPSMAQQHDVLTLPAWRG